MTQYEKLNIIFFNSPFNKLKFAVKNGTEITLNFSSKLIENTHDKNNFLHKLLLTDIYTKFNDM